MIATAYRLPDKTDACYHPDEVWKHMRTGYGLQLAARNCSPGYIHTVDTTLERLRTTFSWPWTWTRPPWERYQGLRAAAGVSLSTRRGEQVIIEGFTRYLADPANGWLELCRDLFGATPQCIVTDANRISHREAAEGNIDVRPATRAEFRQLCAVIDDAVETERSYVRALLAYRDSVFVKLTYAFGTRRAETCEVCEHDFYRNATQPAFGTYGALAIRNGKAKRCGPPRRRTIYTSAKTAWIVPVIERYCTEVRPLFPHAGSDAHLFLTLAHGHLLPNSASSMFLAWRERAGLDPAITLHSLRRSFATHGVEDGYEQATIGAQLGHESDESTSAYIYLTDQVRQDALLAMQEQLGGEP
jgi:integrase/recombinase XerC